MINLERLNQAIAIMERAGKVSMGTWQGGNTHECAKEEEELHKCGNTACFAGWVAVSPEFQAAGGRVGTSGWPRFSLSIGSNAINRWLETRGFKAEVIELLVTGSTLISDSAVEWLQSKDISVDAKKHKPTSNYSYVYLNHWNKYKAPHVIRILEALKS